MPGLIEDYGLTLERRLRFDRRLARRAREEAEAHLRELAACSGSECEAIRRFGSAEAVATDYASALLPFRRRGALTAACLLAALTFVFMRLRSTWLDGLSGAGTIATTIDRTGFAVGVLLCLAALAMCRLGKPDRLPMMLVGAATALTASIAASLYRAGLALPDAGFGSALPVVLVTGAIELGFIVMLAVRLARLDRHVRILG